MLDYVLNNSDKFAYSEERRVFYVALTRAKIKTFIMYDINQPSLFVNEFLDPENITEASYVMHSNADKRWTKRADQYMLDIYAKGMSIKQIAEKMGRSQTAIIMRLDKLGVEN